MIKQIVTETWVNDDVKIDLSYEFPEELKGKREREEVSTKEENKEIIKYFVWVAS